MKIFWSWQSDTPGKTGRFFVREAIEDAIAKLKSEDTEVVEPTAATNRADLHLDHDRQGVPGSPDLASTILAKIDAAVVVIADVTPVGQSAVAKGVPPKKLINSNVAIELGYALGVHSSEHLLMVLNEHYGGRDDLPFDLKHKAGPVIYTLAPDAEAEEIRAERKRLADKFVNALRPYLEALTEDPVEVVRQPAKGSAATWAEDSEVLLTIGDSFDKLGFVLPASPLLYLRVAPLRLRSAPLSRTAMGAAVREISTFGRGGGMNGQNIYGAVHLNPFGSPVAGGATQKSASAVQIFSSGEIWGANYEYVRGAPIQGDLLCMPTQAIERLFRERLVEYLSAAKEKLGVEGPYWVKAGAEGIGGYYLAMPQEFDPMHWGPIHDNQFSVEGTVSNHSDQSGTNQFLLRVFEKIFDLTGYQRPKRLYNFPEADE